jgi:hypothetical protein
MANIKTQCTGHYSELCGTKSTAVNRAWKIQNNKEQASPILRVVKSRKLYIK